MLYEDVARVGRLKRSACHAFIWLVGRGLLRYIELPVCPCVVSFSTSPTHTICCKHPRENTRSILVRYVRHARFPRDMLATFSRGCHDDTTRKLLPWNSSLRAQMQQSAEWRRAVSHCYTWLLLLTWLHDGKTDHQRHSETDTQTVRQIDRQTVGLTDSTRIVAWSKMDYPSATERVQYIACGYTDLGGLMYVNLYQLSSVMAHPVVIKKTE